MKLMSRWFRRAPINPSWIEPVALAARIERDAALLVLDVRGPDELSGPLGHIREAENLPLNELPTQLSDLVRDSRPVVVVCKTDRRHQWLRSSCSRPEWRMYRSCAAGWNGGERSGCRQVERRSFARPLLGFKSSSGRRLAPAVPNTHEVCDKLDQDRCTLRRIPGDR
jgi:hypothetical protein